MTKPIRRDQPTAANSKRTDPKTGRQYYALSELHPDPNNPRKINKQQMQALIASMKKHGQLYPVIFNIKTQQIVAGHQRLAAAMHLGWPELWTIEVNDSAEVQFEKNLATNNVQGTNDEEKLAKLVYDRRGMDFTPTGLSEVTVSKLVDQVMQSAPDLFNAQEEYDKIKEPISKPGEVYQLGEHTLVCGDSTDPTVFQGIKADMVFTDPPYNVDYHSTKKELGNLKNDKLSPEDFQELLLKVFQNIKTFSKAASSVYICTGWSSFPVMYETCAKVGIEIHGNIVWVKPAGGLGYNDYRYRHEQVIKAKNVRPKASSLMYGWMGATKEDGTPHHFYGQDESDVWEMPRQDVTRYEHPTEKPDWLIARAIKNSSIRGELVLDPFAGSGSTMIAAHKSERIAYMVELDPKWCDVIRKRWDRFQGKPEEQKE